MSTQEQEHDTQENSREGDQLRQDQADGSKGQNGTAGSNGQQQPESLEDKQKTEKRKRILVVTAIVAAIVLTMFGVRQLIWSRGHQETDDAYVSGHQHAISSRIAGTVSSVLVNDNEHVQQGQLLVLLDPRDMQSRVDQASASLVAALRQADTAQAAIGNSAQTARAANTQAKGAIGEARASISAQKAAVTEAQAGVGTAQARLDQVNATLKKDKTDLQRFEDLAAKEQVSRQALDHARANYQVSLASQAAASQGVGEAQAKVLRSSSDVARSESMLTAAYAVLEQAKAAGLQTNVRSGEFERAKASIEEARASLQEAELQLSYTKLVAPVTGKVGRKSVEAGQRLQVGQPVLAILEDTPWVTANLKETQLAKVRPGQEVEVRIDTFPKHSFKGHVDSVSPGSGNEFALLPPDNATGNFTKIVQRIPVKITFDRDSMNGYQDLVVPGMSATVTVTTK